MMFHDETESDDDSMDLSNQGLEKFPVDLAKVPKLKFVYLEGNLLTSLPENFFLDLPLLEWCDLRGNNLEELPTGGLANHQNLQVLLLMNNRIKSLPVHLAMMPRLKGLQVAGNPIENVPYDVIAAGMQSILEYLRSLIEPNQLLPVSETTIVNNPTKSGTPMAGSKISRLSVKSRLDVKPSIPRCHKLSFGHYTRRGTALQRKQNKLVTLDDIAKKSKEQFEQERLKQTLQSQCRLLQRAKDVQVVNFWRQMATKGTRSKFLDNYQYSPGRKVPVRPPFGIDHGMMQMLNRRDLEVSLQEWEDSRRGTSTVQKSTDPAYIVREIERKIEEIKKGLNELGNRKPESPRLSSVSSRIDKINQLRQALQKLSVFP